MKKQEFLNTCNEVCAFHIPRWHELPEFDLYMDQVLALAEKYLSVLSTDGKDLLTPSMINNYVKSGVLPPPKNKKYNRTHLAILMIVCITKPVMEISAVAEIIRRGTETNSIENLLNGVATTFENELSTAAEAAKETVETSTQEEFLSFIAMENMMRANAARTVAMHAYRTAKKGEPIEEPKSEKSDKKAEKKKAKADNSESEE